MNHPFCFAKFIAELSNLYIKGNAIGQYIDIWDAHFRVAAFL